jgi:hypothetical protein
MPHCEAQLFVAHVSRLANAAFVWAHCVQLAPLHESSHVTQAWSLLHAVAWVQQLWPRQFAQVEVAVMAGHDAPLELPPEELEQLPDDVEPPPMPPPSPPLDEPQLLLPPLEDEHPMTTAVAATIPKVTATEHVRTKRMTGFIGEVLPLALRGQHGRVSREAAPHNDADRDFRCGPRGVI